ncbi:hypothetical protein PYW07_002778 [Mythimna separata]|uniref:Sperm microtubule inner protein 1 C-terminal domain-containing protein n=1 Tax=Mythimna separata TaxID=271217 RepID=A0AAD7YGZ5_MYTSE|nr:hypothetical protein PYW07_002778 [Mythimna separata]
MSLDYTDEAKHKFMIECNNKANQQRTRWFLRHKDKLVERARCTEKNKHYTNEEIEETRLKASFPALSQQHEVAARHRRRCLLTGAGEITALGDAILKSEEFPIMKPVDSNEASIIYKELAAGGGRRAYLNARQRKLPELKYNDCPTTNSEYGWALHDSSVRSGAPEYKRYAIYFRYATRPSGVHPDPPHYDPPAKKREICKGNLTYRCFFK